MKCHLPVLVCLLIIFCILLAPVQTGAVTPLEPGREASLTLYYTRDGQGFGDLSVQIYRVAQAHPDGSFTLVSPFSGYPVNIHGITSQKEWQDTATTLISYIAANAVDADHTQTTASDGTVLFSGLTTGLYLVKGVTAENDTGTYIFRDFLVYLPAPQESGGYDYDVEARPKCSSFTPKTEYRVLKLWKDALSTAQRPKSVSIRILKDGILQETVTLRAENDWSYSWKVSADDSGKWSVMEEDVPSPYQVTVSESGSVFTVTNTLPSAPSEPPKTGDSFAFWPWVMTMCLSGSLLLVLAVSRKRRA